MIPSSPILVFDIETIPDVQTGKRLHPELANLSDTEATTALIALREQEANSSFMRLPLHQIACLSMLWIDLANQRMKLASFSLDQMNEAKILETFFNVFNPKKLPNLVSWNGSNFDLPVIQFRAMHHQLSAKNLFSEDEKYNNYLNRYHQRHLDLMDKLAFYNNSNRQPLDLIASLCGLAGKQDIDGSQVVGLVQAEEWHKLQVYCESDVINTWLLYLRWRYLIGDLDQTNHEYWQTFTLNYLKTLKNTDNSLRHQGFLSAWDFAKTHHLPSSFPSEPPKDQTTDTQIYPADPVVSDKTTNRPVSVDQTVAESSIDSNSFEAKVNDFMQSNAKPDRDLPELNATNTDHTKLTDEEDDPFV